MHLSKSKYVAGCQCPKILWMNAHMPEKFVSKVDASVAEKGNRVGDLAMGYYGDFVEIEFDERDFAGMATRTRKLMDAGEAVICEATFLYGQNLCMVDILRVEEDGVHVIEVKSATDVKEHYLEDVAFQVWVLRNCGIHVKSASLMHLNSSYIFDGELDLEGLFVVKDVTKKVFDKQQEVAQKVESFNDFCNRKDEPVFEMSRSCSEPFECGYYDWCWRDLVHPGVTDVVRLKGAKKCELYNSGLRTMQDLLNAEVALSQKQMLQVEVEACDLDPVIDKNGIQDFLDKLTYPLYFLDFETVQPVIPLYVGTRPYQQVVTQYSLHILDSPTSKVRHKEFLADECKSPARQVAKNLVADIPKEACTLAWNKTFECTRIAEMASEFEDLSEHLLNICDNILDLGTPFADGSYYMKEFQGSWSIKKVLPALFPNDPNLDYHALEGVHHGGEAMEAFERLRSLKGDKRETLRNQLLRYCELDTFAMVKILEKLYAATV